LIESNYFVTLSNAYRVLGRATGLPSYGPSTLDLDLNTNPEA